MIIKVKAKPGSSRQEIIEKENVFHVNLKQSPKANKANIELINLLARHFNKPANSIKILRGKTSHNKIIEIK